MERIQDDTYLKDTSGRHRMTERNRTTQMTQTDCTNLGRPWDKTRTIQIDEPKRGRHRQTGRDKDHKE